MANWVQRFLTAIATHKADVSAHHTKYTDAEAVTAAKADADIADAITKKHARSHSVVSALDHSDRMTKAWMEWTANKLLLGAGAGADPTEIDVPTAGATIVRKTADESSTVVALHNDLHLFFSVTANEIWVFDLYLDHIFNVAVDNLVIAFTIPAAGALEFITIGQIGQLTANGGAAPPLDGTASLEITGAINIRRHWLGKYRYVGGANAGTIQLQWGVRVGGNNTTLYANSYILAHKIG